MIQRLRARLASAGIRSAPVCPVRAISVLVVACAIGMPGVGISAATNGAPATAAADTVAGPGAVAAVAGPTVDGPFRLLPPRPIRSDFLYDTETTVDLESGLVTTRRTVGGVLVSPPEVAPLNVYIDGAIAEKRAENLATARRRLLTPQERTDRSIRMQFEIPNLPPMAKSVIGEGPSSLNVSGYGRITMSGESQYTSGTSAGPIRQSKFPTLAMKQELAFQINGTIGSKVFVAIDQDTRRLSDLDNNIRLRYQGEEDEIVKEVEMGNTSLSLQGPRFVSGSRQNKGLFGIKGRGEVGNLEFTVIASQQKSSAQRRSFRGGATESEVKVDEASFVAKRFYFIDSFYRRQYEAALARNRANPTENYLVTPDTPPFEILDVQVWRNAGGTVGTVSGTWKTATADHFALADSNGGSLLGTYPAQIDPASISPSSRNYETGSWQELAQGTDYTWNPVLGTIDFGRSLQSTEAIGVIIRYRDAAHPDGAYFPQSTDPNKFVLKTIKVAPDDEESDVWTYEWRNVYYVGATQLSADDFRLEIQEKASPFETQSGSRTYLEILGLDYLDAGNSPKSDGQVDAVKPRVDLDFGLVYFPWLEPFREAFENVDGDIAPNTVLYTSTNPTNIADASRLQLVARYSKASDQISLGAFGILENSEVIKLDGKRLQKGIDYDIDYFTGRVTFQGQTRDDVKNPGAVLTIDYEVNPLFQVGQESLLGFRGVYRLGERGQIGGTFLYNSERSASTRVRVGEEPTTMSIMGLDAQYEFRPFWITRAVDGIPLIESDEPSRLRLEGEIAQSLPNLNTRGIGYVDDFEGAKTRTPIPIFRTAWTKSSLPYDPEFPTSLRTPEERGRLVWFDTWNGIIPGKIWTVSKSENTLQNAVRPLNFWFRPEAPTPIERKRRWAGIMRSFGQSGIDLENAQFLEFTVRVSQKPFTLKDGEDDETTTPPTGNPKLYVELGSIAENVLTASRSNIFYNSELNAEEQVIDSLYVDRPKWPINGVIEFADPDQGEDVGLDGCPDLYENGSGGCLTVPNLDGGVDPNGDNWKHPRNGEEALVPANWDSVNGTEGNRNFDSQRGDTEDLNGNSALDYENEYARYEIDLGPMSPGSESPYLFQTITGTGFRVYRIPIHDLRFAQMDSGGGLPDFNRITGVRMWITGVEDEQVWLTIPRMEFVGNQWKAQKAPGDDFTVATLSTEDRESGYTRPPGVKEELDASGRALPEQSVSIEFSEIPPSHVYRATRTIFGNLLDMTNYRRLRVFINGPSWDEIDRTNDDLQAFIRFGPSDTTVYYEIRIPTRLLPGWDQNVIDIPLDSLTNLKITDSGEIFTGTEIHSEDGTMHVFGSFRSNSGTVLLPALTGISVLQVGVRNASDHTIRSRSGKPIRVLFDDFRLEEARNTPSVAYRGGFDLTMADLVSFQVNAERQGMSFGSIGQKKLNGERTRSLSLTMNHLRIDKLLPPDWRVSIPFNMSYDIRTGDPRLKGGSDIELTDPRDRARERSRNESFTASTSYAKSSRSRNPFIGLTLDRAGLGVTYRTTRTVEPPRTSGSRDSTRSYGYSARFNYDLTPRREHTVRPLAWTSALMPDVVSDVELSYLPSALRFDANTSFSSQKRFKTFTNDLRDTINTRSFTLAEDYRIGFQPIRSIQANYDLRFDRDLRNALETNESPEVAARAVLDNVFRRNEIRRTMRTSFSYGPSWPWWLSHSYAWSNSYNDNTDPRENPRLLGLQERTFAFTSTRSYSISSVTLKVREILGWMSGGGAPALPPTRPQPTPSDPGTGFPGNEYRQQVSNAAGGGGSSRGILRSFAGFVGGHVENISGRISYSEGFNASQRPFDERPDLAYQIFGYGGDPLIDSLDRTRPGLSTVNTTNKSRSLNAQAGSGVVLPFNMRLRGSWSFQQQRAFTPQKTTRSETTTLPDLTYSWEGLESLPLLSIFATRSDIQSSFQRSRDRTWEKAYSDTSERATNRGTRYAMSPLFAWNVLWKNRMRTTIRSTWSHDSRITQSYQSNTDPVPQKSTNWDVNFTTNYEIQTSRGVKKPWGGLWRLKGNINISCDASYQSSRAWGSTIFSQTNKTSVTSDTRRWQVRPRASYRFSDAFTGEAGIVVGQSKDLINNRTTNTRGLRISGELRFN